jgi:hypothetical protein
MIAMTIAAFVISVCALLASAASVIYIRRQAVHASEVASIERQRSHAERTPDLEVRPTLDKHDDPTEHPAEIVLTNRNGFALHRISVRPILDRPGKPAIVGIQGALRAPNPAVRLPIERLDPGQSTTFEVVLAPERARTKCGIVQFTVHDREDVEWIIETELHFGRSPRAWAL